MKLTPGLYALLLILSSLIGSIFMFKFYGYIIYAIIGIILYVFIKLLGRHVVFIYMIPLLVVALPLVGPLFLVDFYDLDGLNPLNLHPLVISWLIAFILKFGEDLLNRKVAIDKIVVFSFLVLTSFFGITLFLKGTEGIALAIHNYLGPITLFLFFYFEKKNILPKVNQIILITIWFSVALGLFGIIEYLMQANPLEGLYREGNIAWYDASSREGYRIKTIIGHPLSNALYFLFAMMLVQLRVKGLKFKYGLMLLFMIDILLTGSRSMFAFAFLVILYNADSFKGDWMKVRQNLIRVVLIGAVLIVTFTTSLGSTFLSRVGGASSSTEARLILWSYFLDHMTSLQVLGLGGATASVTILGSDGNPIILENPWVILFIDVGYLMVFYILLLFFIVRKVSNKYLVLVFILATSGFNSFGVKSNVNYYLFYLLIYGYLLMQDKRAQADQEKNSNRIEVQT